MKLTKQLLHTTDKFITTLTKSGISTVQQLLEYFPRDLEDKSNVLKAFAYVNIKEKNVVECTVQLVKSERTRNNKQITKVVVIDDNEYMCECVFFGRNFRIQSLQIGDRVRIFGKPKYEYGKLSFPSPDIEKVSPQNESFTPIYPSLHGISSDWFHSKIKLIQGYIKTLPEVLPETVLAKKQFTSHAHCIYKMHFPKTKQDFETARKQLIYEELFAFQARGLQNKLNKQKDSEGKAVKIPMNPAIVKEATSTLPFTLTDHQRIALFQVLQDMEKPYMMQRLLQGDVGTGKTAVAFISAYHAIKEGGVQVAMMAPTAILAMQHYLHAKEFFEPLGISVAILVGSQKKSEKAPIKEGIKTGEMQFVVGTHALIQEDVVFQDLGYIVVDEQHRFGVQQRKALENANMSHKIPHALNMSATPIPRSLALSLYGDQDLSIISQYPAGRKDIYTRVVQEYHRPEAHKFIQEHLKQGRQVYWISPLVEESDTLDEVQDVINMTDKLRVIFPNYQVDMLHGRMKAKEKDAIMADFNENKIQILSSTSVVEVGVNNPNATIMCIEGADRFGLSQLHQFRGRVGRGEHQSYCYLFTTKQYKNDRLKAMEETNDGFKLSEIDLDLRGPGEVYGVRQSGILDFKIAKFADFGLLPDVREDVEEYFDKKIN